MKKVIGIILITIALLLSAKDWVDINEGLCYEVSKGSIEDVRNLISQGADVNYLNYKGYTPLYYAVKAQRQDMIEFLVDSGADINLTNNKKYSNIFTEAVYIGDFDILKYLLSLKIKTGNNIEKQGFTIYHFLIREFDGKEEDLVQLFDLIYNFYPQININHQDDRGNTAAYYAVYENREKALFFLIDKGADLSINNKRRTSTMSMIKDSRNRNKNIINYLKQKNASLYPDNEKLLEALLKKDYPTFEKYLSHHKINLYVIDIEINYSVLGIIFRTQDNEAMRLVIKSDQDLRKNIPYNEGHYSVIHYATIMKDISSLKICIIKHNIDVNTMDSQGYTPLAYAVQYHNYDSVEYLIQQGANVNFKTKKGDSILHLAARHSNREITKLLLDKGAGINTKNNNGHTPLDLAIVSKNSEIINLLRKYGAPQDQNRDDQKEMEKK